MLKMLQALYNANLFISHLMVKFSVISPFTTTEMVLSGYQSGLPHEKEYSPIVCEWCEMERMLDMTEFCYHDVSHPLQWVMSEYLPKARCPRNLTCLKVTALMSQEYTLCQLISKLCIFTQISSRKKICINDLLYLLPLLSWICSERAIYDLPLVKKIECRKWNASFAGLATEQQIHYLQ